MVEHGLIFGNFLFVLMIVFLFNAVKFNRFELYFFILLTILFMTTEVITDRSRGLIFFVSVISFYANYEIKNFQNLPAPNNLS